MVAIARKRSAVTADSSQSVWPHLIIGFLLAAAGVVYLGGEPSITTVAGSVGAVLGYLRHCWIRPMVRCWWPTWFWLGWFGLKGCGTRATTGGKYYAFNQPCPLHPNSPYYRRLGARLLGREKPKVKP